MLDSPRGSSHRLPRGHRLYPPHSTVSCMHHRPVLGGNRHRPTPGTTVHDTCLAGSEPEACLADLRRLALFLFKGICYSLVIQNVKRPLMGERNKTGRDSVDCALPVSCGCLI